MTPCAIYLRTSVEESRGEYALVSDLEMCRSHAAAQGYIIIGEFNDMRPDGSMDRPGLNTLRHAMSEHGGGIMIIPRDEALAPDASDRQGVADALESENILIEVARPLAAQTTVA
ncbi:MAG: hypothetical protein RLZZ387_2281 [Chloroflexota bacterium]|jgi:DNA invertase Pin-like site-specific DNA recombinase